MGVATIPDVSRFQHYCFNFTPFPSSGTATGSSNGLHLKAISSTGKKDYHARH